MSPPLTTDRNIDVEMNIDPGDEKTGHPWIGEEVKWLKWIDKLSDFGGIIGGALIPVATCMIFYEVIKRYFFKSPSTWVTEISIYMVLASVLLSIAYTLKENYHIRVDFITNMLSARAKTILEIVTSFLALSFCFYLIWEGAKLTLEAFMMGEKTATILRAPRFVLLGLVPLGGAMLALQYLHILQRLFKAIPRQKTDGDRQSTRNGILVSGGLIFLLIIGILLIKNTTVIAATILFFSLLMSGMPVSLALSLFGMFCFIFFFESPTIISQLPLVTYGTLDNEILSSVPYFIFCGIIFTNGQVSRKLFDFAHVWVRHLPGGIAIASMIFCAIFAAISGSSPATAATISLLALPEMLSRGYEKKFVLGLLAAGGTLGILIPPSIPMMIYGAMTDESISQLFMAGLIPGLILTGMFILYIVLVNKFGEKELPRGGEKATLREKLSATKSATTVLTIPIIILGGIYSGIFTPTEAAAVASVYSMLVCVILYRTLPMSIWKKTLLETARTSSMLMFLVVGANIAGQALTMMQLAQNALQYIISLQLPPWLVLISINLFLIILGMPLEAISILVITLPILHPLIVNLGFSPLWFAVIMVINMEMALISPPEGLNLFILQRLGNATTADVSKGVIPFLIVMAIFLIIVSCFPVLSTWLPSILIK